MRSISSRRAPRREEVAQAIVRELGWYDQYLDRGGSRPRRQYHARQQGRRPVEHRREGDGIDRQERLRADRMCWRRANGGIEAKGPGVCCHARQRFHLVALQLAAGMKPVCSPPAVARPTA